MKFQICSLKRATALLCAGLLLHHLLTFVQAGEIDDQIRELLTPAPSVPDEENAWLAMQALPERVVQQELRSKPFIVFPKEASPDKPAGVDRAWLKEQMEANAELMRMGAEVLKRPGFSVHLR